MKCRHHALAGRFDSNLVGHGIRLLRRSLILGVCRVVVGGPVAGASALLDHHAVTLFEIRDHVGAGGWTLLAAGDRATVARRASRTGPGTARSRRAAAARAAAAAARGAAAARA